MAGASGNIKSPAWYTGGLAGVLAPGAGNVYYVNGGSDGPVNNAFDGTRADRPKQTLQAAIDLCTANNNDYVIVLNYGGNARAVETWPVTVDCDMIHIIGVGSLAQKWPVVSVLAPAAADTANPALLVTASRVEIAGLEIGGGDTAGCVHTGLLAGTWGTEIHDCFFGVTGDAVGQDGIRVPVTFDSPYLTVWGCRFGGFITRDGVRIDGVVTRGSIGVLGKPRNLFTDIPGVAINLLTAIDGCGVYDNVISIPANTAGAGITLSATCTDCHVFGNQANFGDTTMGNNPFADGAGAGANNWGLNYQGITAVMPS